MTTILSIYDITCTVFMTSHALYMTSHLLCMISHSLYVWHRTMYLWHHTQYIYHIISNIYDTTLTAFMTTQWLYLTSHPLYLTSHPLYLCHHTHSIDDITANICIYHIQYSCDVLSTIFMTSYPLCMTSQPCMLITPHSAYVWHHLHYRWHHIHSITPNHSIYDVTSTSGMTSHPSHPLNLCHHKLSTDITHTLVWHHTHSLCDIICTLSTSLPLLMSSVYSTYDITTSMYETTSSM